MLATTETQIAGQVSAIREFNRFYTARLGLLRKRHLDGEFSLTEARILYEIGSQHKLTASTLRDTLGLDPGYISRLLGTLARRKLVRQTASTTDGREKFLTLSAAGKAKVAKLDSQSSMQIQELLGALAVEEREVVATSLSKVRSILRAALRSDIRIIRLTELHPDALSLLHEYYEAINVVLRDTPEDIQQMITGKSSGVWLAYLDGTAVGCVALRKLTAVPLAGECKRLYLQPHARGKGIAGALLDAQERYAVEQGLRWIYLDSKDDLHIAIALYKKRGYVPCERYNDNPQATVFLRKRIAA